MLTRWLTFTAFLIGSVNPDRAAIGQDALTVAPTCRIKGHPEVELTLNCGDEKHAGVVKYWHTPYGDFHTPSFYSKLDPVFMHHDGSLVFPNSSRLHSGLYYCLQQHTDGATLWSYELHVGPNNQKNQEHGGYEGGSSCGALRFRRDVGSEEEKQAEVSYGQFAGAVVASVLLTFVLGFSAGALSRNHVLRCLETVTKRLQSLRQQQCQTDGSEVTMTTLPPMYDNRAQMEQMWDDDSTNCASMETTISSTASSPPAKPQRSFRHKREQEQEITAYLKGCDHVKEEEKRLEEEEEVRRSLEEKNKGCDGEAEEEEGENGASETETDEDKCSEDREKKDGRRESGEEEVEDDNRSKENGVETSSSEEEKWRDEKMGEEGWREERGGDDGEKKRSEEDEEEDISRDSKESSGDTEDETCGKKHGVERGEEGEEGGEGGEGGDGREGGEGRKGSEGGEGGEASSSLLRPGRRSRVIRLYQYNEDGQRYCHLPDSAPGDTGPAPRLKQRSLSLTRLNAIMAAASAGPLDTSQRETEREEKQEKPHFHMEI
ncbi:hypothetical protein PAMP_018162 [Pampus punctatissimus]